MTALFGSPRRETPQQVAPPPERSSTETANMIEAQRRRFFGVGEGRVSTMLSGGATESANRVVRMFGDTGA